jgi:hypothetical protein
MVDVLKEDQMSHHDELILKLDAAVDALVAATPDAAEQNLFELFQDRYPELWEAAMRDGFRGVLPGDDCVTYLIYRLQGYIGR